MIDAAALIVRLIPPGQAVLLIGDDLQAVTDALDIRGCVCRSVGVEKTSDWTQVAAIAAEAGASSIVIFDGFGRIADPVGLLRALGSLVPPHGTLIVVADNAGHLARRLDGLRATPHSADAGDVPNRPFHLPTLRSCLAAAGLTMQDLFRVVRPVDEAVDDEVRRLGLDDLINQPEASTTSFVAVTAPAGTGPRVGGGVAEYLHGELDEVSRQLTNERRRADGLADRVTQLGSLVATQASDLSLAQCQIDELLARLREREMALTDRLRELERKHLEQRHLRLDGAVKDDFVADLRAQLQAVVIERDRAENEVARLLEDWDRPLYDAAEWIDVRLARVRSLVARSRRL